MSKKMDPRLPRDIGKGSYSSYAAIKTPWEKLIGYREGVHYVSRYNAVVSSALMQALRILVPDYQERAAHLCKEAYERLYYVQSQFGAEQAIKETNIHPFCRGSFTGGLVGDAGDDALLMCGRVNDFGTYRVEKELDVCDWDIVGSELCRATTQSLEGTADAVADKLRKGPRLEYHMVEAKGCGDRHCRIVAECREKFPMPPHEQWECFGPIATSDQIKFTPEEECVSESQIFREESNYTFANGTNWERTPDETMLTTSSAAVTYILPCFSYLIQNGILEEKTVDHVIHCVCEAAGKAYMGDYAAKKGLADWLGAPWEVLSDGRILGGHIEVYLQSAQCPYEVEAFNKDEVIYVIDRNAITCMGSQLKYADALVAFWYGMSKTLINAQWALWEEPGDTPADKLRIKIAKKIDKFC